MSSAHRLFHPVLSLLSFIAGVVGGLAMTVLAPIIGLAAMGWVLPQAAWRRAGTMARGAMVASPVAISGLLWHATNPSPEAAYCSRAEYIVQEAGACLLRPERSRTQARIDAVYGTAKPGCTTLLAQLGDVNVAPEEAMGAAAWAEAKASNVRAFWRSALGAEFCTDMRRRQD